MAAFAAFGIRALRGQTEREFPDARETRLVPDVAGRVGTAVRGSGMGERLSRLRRPTRFDRQAEPGGEDPPPAATEDEGGQTDEATRLARLQQLGALRDSGVLDEDEFAAMKARVLAGMDGGNV
jgi:hypothetical protein